jgi:SpoVK/Ycf46/Vps4 family AAA+-type ATPase
VLPSSAPRTDRMSLCVHSAIWQDCTPLIICASSEQDSALMRPGRLDRILYVGPPDLAGRIEILKIRTRKMAVDPNINLDEIAALVRMSTPGCGRMLSGHSCRRMAAQAQRSLHYARRRRSQQCRKISTLLLSVFRFVFALENRNLK